MEELNAWPACLRTSDGIVFMLGIVNNAWRHEKYSFAIRIQLSAIRVCPHARLRLARPYGAPCLAQAEAAGGGVRFLPREACGFAHAA